MCEVRLYTNEELKKEIEILEAKVNSREYIDRLNRGELTLEDHKVRLQLEVDKELLEI